jgi:hypothetical protein
MSNSPLVDYTIISPNKTSPRNHKIDTITIHCTVCQCSIEALGRGFAAEDRDASSNYGIGTDGRIGMFVEEKDRSWCSSSASNDNRAITIECASDAYDPYKINDKVYASLIELCADICKRNGIKELKWRADKTLIGQVDKQNMTVHRWFKNKECPGKYIYDRLGKIAAEVNAKLESPDTVETEKPRPEEDFKVNVDISNLSIRKGAGTNFARTGKYTGKGTFTIVDTKTGAGSKKGWGKLKNGEGWISLDYADKIS